ncbi:phage holin family protein [Propionicimonas sp.]|uniref:phage holin family protein n=1 Tax=Propionicimonas sp. TaxID=1955623 RepID=UPI0039E2625E
MTASQEPVLPQASPPARLAPERSIGELMGDVTRDLSTLLRQEVELAKAELRESGTQAGKGVGLLAGGAVGAVFVLLFASITAWWGIGLWVGNVWSALIVAAIWAVIAVILVQSGRSELARVRGLPMTAETVSKIPNAVKGNEEENR